MSLLRPRARSFHLHADALLPPHRTAGAGTSTTSSSGAALDTHPNSSASGGLGRGLGLGFGLGLGLGAEVSLLALARHASAAVAGGALALLGLGGCAPGGWRQRRRRVPRALLAGKGDCVGETEVEEAAEEAGGGSEESSDGGCSDGDQETDSVGATKDAESREIVPLEVGAQHGPELTVGETNSVDTREHDCDVPAAPPELEDAPLSKTAIEATVTAPPIVAQHDLEHPAAVPAEHTIRTDIVRKFSAFTAARLSRAATTTASSPVLAATPPPPSRRPAAPLDDPFAETTPAPATPRAQFVPAHPLRLHYPSLLLRADQQQSPTPQPRPGRLPLRQQTVFFKQPRVSTMPSPPPKYWAPHPAGARSCAIAIKAPLGASRAVAGDKENYAMV